MTKVLFVTMDMLPGTERLMPWRTVCEVTKYLNRNETDTVLVYSGENISTDTIRTYDGCRIYSGSKNMESIARYCEQNEYDTLIYPFAFRDCLKSFEPLGKLNIQKIGYVPGGIYPMEGIISLAKQEGVKSVKSYLIEKFFNHGRVLRKLRSAGFTKIVTLSEYTRNFLMRHGWSEDGCITIIPGLDDFRTIAPDYSLIKTINKSGRKYILFSGAPATIRGSRMLLEAFDIFAEKNQDTDLIMLMRTDLSSVFDSFKSQVAALRHKDRVAVSFQKLTPPQLKAFFEGARVVALPFILVPSEIPLTFFEVLSCGTPIVSFDNNGTTEYFKEGVYTAHKRRPDALASLLQELLTDDFPSDELRSHIKEISNQYPTWNQAGKKWEEFINR